MKHPILFRIILDGIIFWSVINGWWFIAMPMVIVGMWLCPVFIEMFIAGVMYDALFGMNHSLGIWGYTGTITVSMFFIIRSVLKRIVR